MQLSTKYCPNCKHPVTMLAFFQSKTFNLPVNEPPFLHLSALFSFQWWMRLGTHCVVFDMAYENFCGTKGPLNKSEGFSQLSRRAMLMIISDE